MCMPSSNLIHEAAIFHDNRRPTIHTHNAHCMCIHNLFQVAKTKEDIIPHHPFLMVPTGTLLFLRKKLGSAAILRAARSPFKHINIQNLPKPTSTYTHTHTCTCNKYSTKLVIPFTCMHYTIAKVQY